MHYFSCLSGPGTVSIKSAQGHITLNLCFASGGICGSRSAFLCDWVCETLTHYFSCSGGLGAVSIKSVLGHVTPNMCFCILWDPWVT
jgi:hypothetical protein